MLSRCLSGLKAEDGAVETNLHRLRATGDMENGEASTSVVLEVKKKASLERLHLIIPVVVHSSLRP